MSTTLLMLADGRLPAGGHAHSGGAEAAVAAKRITDVPTLAAFLRGRLATTGLVAAAFAASTMDIAALDDGLDARTASPALRRASRAQGRALLRAGRAIWPPADAPRAGRAVWPPADAPRADVHHPVALGIVARAAGLTPHDAALAAAYGTVTGPAGAAVRLLGLDPFAVHAVVASLAPGCDAVAARAAGYANAPVDDLPAEAAPLLDLDAEHHATWEVRLFAS
jgi:urease accessory protein